MTTYAVDIWTKKHRIASTECGPITCDERLVRADQDGWVEWSKEDGSPLPDEHPCDVMLFGSRVVPNVVAYENPEWAGVTHYRPILDAETKPEPPVWDGEGSAQIGHRVACRSEPEIEQFMVVYIHDDKAWLRDVDTGRDSLAPAENIRPILSEEDRLTEEAMELIGVESDEYGAESVIYRMIKAGYRKQ